MASYDEDEDEPHMLAVETGDDFCLHDGEDVLDLDDEEEMMMMMHPTKESPPPQPLRGDEEDEPAVFVMPKAASTTGVDDSFESYIFETDNEDDFQARGRNHVIPVINSSPTKKKSSPNADSLTDPSSSPQSPSTKGSPESPSKSPAGKSPGKGLFGQKTYQGEMYVSPPSSSECEASPTPAGALQSAFSEPNGHIPKFRYSSPVIQTQPASMLVTSPRAQSAPLYTRQTTPPTVPDGKTPIVLDTPQGYRQPLSKGNVEQSSSSSRRRSSTASNGAFIWGMSKPVFCILAFYLLFMTGSFCYFVSQYVKIPNLKEQVEQLSAEVDRLEAEVDALELLIAELNATVYDLSVEVAELTVENNKLETQNAILEEATGTFGNQTQVFQEQVDTLQSTVSNLTLANEALKEEAFNLELLNGELTNLTVELQENNTELAAIAENLTAVNDELVESNEALTNQTDALQASLEEMVLEFDAAYETVVELQDETGSLQEENARLGNLTQSLGTILSFLEETNQDADLTVDELSRQLEEQVTNNRRLVLENLQNTLTQRTQTWNCDYINAFSGSGFVQDYTVPIPSGSYDAVLDYVESRVLTDLCLDRSDFELYLSINFMPNGDGLTSNELISGVSKYTSDALNHYFPDSGEAGVTPEEWAEAEYNCANFPPERQYRATI